MALLALIAAAAAVGSLVLRAVPFRDSVEAWTFRLLAGLCGCALVAVSLGSYSLTLALGVVYGVAAAGLLAEIFVISRRAPDRVALRPAWTLMEKLSVAACGAGMLLALLSALAPVTGWDAAVAHLALPAVYSRAGHICFHEGNVYSGYPHLMHSLYVLAYHGGGELPVSLLSWFLGVLACGAVYALGLRIEGRACGFLAAAFLATAPVFMDQAGSVTIDLPFTALSTAALAALVCWFDERRWSWLLLGAVLAGSACGVRHTGYLVYVFCGLAVLAGSRGAQIRAAVVFGVLVLAAALPWLVRSAWLTGNPFFPLLGHWFPSETVPHVVVGGPGTHESLIRGGGTGLLTLLRFPWDIIMLRFPYDGWRNSPGPMVLVLGLPGLFIAGGRARRLGLFSIAGGIALFYYQRLARYLLPFFAPMYVIAAAAACRLTWLRRVLFAVFAVVFAFGLALHAAAVYVKLPVIAGRETRDEYLRSRIERYPAFTYANERMNEGGVILSPDQRTYYLRPESYQNHWAMLQAADLPAAEQVAWLRAHRIHYIIVPWSFIEESGALRDKLVPLFTAWTQDEVHFRVMDEKVFPNPRGGRPDRVTFLEVREGGDT